MLRNTTSSIFQCVSSTTAKCLRRTSTDKNRVRRFGKMGYNLIFPNALFDLPKNGVINRLNVQNNFRDFNDKSSTVNGRASLVTISGRGEGDFKIYRWLKNINVRLYFMDTKSRGVSTLFCIGRGVAR